MEDYLDNNKAYANGIVKDIPSLSHNIYGENFYSFTLKIMRLSGKFDEIIVLFSERLYDPTQIKKDELFLVDGQFRSYNITKDNGAHKLKILLFAKEMRKEDKGPFSYENIINLTGYICKKPIYRKTPFGREITDILLAVNRSYNKSDYLPCVFWGRNARYSKDLDVGAKITLEGRMQSRKYEKKKRTKETITKKAYEVSVSKFKVLEEEKATEGEQR